MSETTPTRQGLWFPKDVFLSTNGIRDWDIPRNGLVALWDPYRDVYGRNCLPVGAENFVRNAWLGDWWYWNYDNSGSGTVTTGQSDPFGGNGAVKLEGASGATSFWRHSGGVATSGVKYFIACYVKAISAGGVKITSYSGLRGTESIITPEMGWVRASMLLTGDGASHLAMSIDSGDESPLKCYAYHPQINIGPVLHAYSAPAGAPGTLQTSLDYSGNGNHLTLGATTNASTDDPAFDGTAWRFDGGDYLTGPTTPMWSNTAGLTVLGVFNPSFGSNAYIASQYSTSNKRSWQLVGNTFDVQELATSYDANTIATLSTGFETGAVQFSCGRWRPAEKAQIIRGNFVETATAANAVNDIADASTPLVIGTNADKGAFLSGSMNLLAIYNRYLVDSEISRAYLYLKGLMAMRGVTLA